MNKKTTPIEKKYPCPICGGTFFTVFNCDKIRCSDCIYFNKLGTGECGKDTVNSWNCDCLVEDYFEKMQEYMIDALTLREELYELRYLNGLLRDDKLLLEQNLKESRDERSRLYHENRKLRQQLHDHGIYVYN